MVEILWKSQYISSTEHNKYGKFPKDVNLDTVTKFILSHPKYKVRKSTIYDDGFDILPNTDMWKIINVVEDPISGLKKNMYSIHGIKYMCICFDFATITIYKSGTFDIYSWTEDPSYYQSPNRSIPLKSSLKSMGDCILFVKELWNYIK